ncbi:HAMP domain-containing sensor histidine kinase [soil metagenome]
MRRRLLVATVGTVAVGVLLLGLPLAVAVRGLLTNQALDTLQRQAEQAQVLFNQPRMDSPDRRALLRDVARELDVRFQVFERASTDSGLVVFRVTGDTLGDLEPPGDFTADLETAVDGEVGRARHEGLLAVSVPLRIDGVPQVLRAVASDESLRAELSAALLSIAGLAVTSLGLAGLVGLLLARRLALPLEDLAVAAAQLGKGDFTARAPRSGIPESDQVATALDVTADRLGLLVERNRSFGADASHQLRTPLTALRLDLEALEVSGADEALLGAAFAEADRLEATIEELLTLADVPMGDEHLQLAVLVEERVASWVSLAQAEGREVLVRSDPVPLVRARGAAIGQCLQVLLDNALEHGEGTITVTVQSIPSSEAVHRGWVRLGVTDEGPGFGEADVPGRGLRLAKSLVQAEGGRIKVERSATVCLLLPTVPIDHSALVPPPSAAG